MSGLEEGMADALAFEIIQEYVRSYPDDLRRWTTGVLHKDHSLPPMIR